MLLTFRKIFFVATFNLSLFFILMIGIQNSSNKSRISLIASETVLLPISFIIGTSFISGSIAGSFLALNFKQEK